MEKQSTVGYCSIHIMGVIYAIENSMWERADENIRDVYAIFMDDDGNVHDSVLGKKEWNQIADRHNKRLYKELQGEDCCHPSGGIDSNPVLDNAERDYLKAVLKPFRKDVRGIEDDPKKFQKMLKQTIDEYRSDMMKLGLLEDGQQ